MSDNEKKPKKKITKAYQTNPITQAQRREPESNVGVPSEMDVKDAKDWVDYNKL
jgi:hypothetical protein